MRNTPRTLVAAAAILAGASLAAAAQSGSSSPGSPTPPGMTSQQPLGSHNPDRDGVQRGDWNDDSAMRGDGDLTGRSNGVGSGSSMQHRNRDRQNRLIDQDRDNGQDQGRVNPAGPGSR